ncbi:ROK family protein [Neobacillus mesonae]|uniref:ROK family protein n=1 Tax=Neobacillus mesonae TaxID=1193713 RepID=UPI00257471A7|nr:ROK family protein [Neobacillus mesonae]
MMRYFISLDIGGTDIKYGIISEAGEVVVRDKTPTKIEKGVARLIENVRCVVGGLLSAPYEIAGIGISTAGVVDPISGAIVYAGETMPGYAGTNFKRILAESFPLPVIVHNDVNAAALGEGWMGAARGVDTYFCLTLGTGIGGAIVIDKKLYMGKNFKAAEIGYMGKSGQGNSIFEKRAATSALVKKASLQLKREDLTGEDIFERAKVEQKYSVILDEWMEEVAKGIADIICVLDPGLIIIGGGVSRQKAFLSDKIREKLSLFLSKGFLETTTLTTAKCGNDAGMLGAVYGFL